MLQEMRGGAVTGFFMRNKKLTHKNSVRATTRCAQTMVLWFVTSIWLLGALLACVNEASAGLSLELTQGVDAAVPIAVVPFAGQSQVNNSEADIAQVVHDDLHHSGRFNPLAMQNLRQQPHQAQEVDFSYWQHERVDYVVVGKLEALPGNNYLVDFALINVFDTPKAAKGKGNVAKAPDQEQILLHQRLTVKASGLRRVAHHISDLVYEKLTGERGIFSTKIAFIQVLRKDEKSALHRLLVADADGHNPRMLLESPLPIMSPSWSPDGRELAYVSFEAKRSRIFVSNVLTGARRLISSYPGINGAPAWSPDGRRIALVLSKGGYRGRPKLYLSDPQGQRLQQLTQGNSIDTEPSWTPKGDGIVFTSDRGGTPQIYLLTIATGQLQRLTYDGDYNARASFSSNGRYLTMLHREEGKFNIAVMDVKTGELRLLTHSVSNESPSFAPNGHMILYAAESGRYGELGVVSIDGRVSLRLPASEGDVQSPTWSPYLDWS